MNIELTKSYVVYQAQTKLLELDVEVAEAQKLNKPEINEKIDLATRTRLWLKALQYSDYLEKSTIDLLVYCLADICDANAIPYAPVITTVDPPSILVGIPGDDGATGPEGPEGGGVPFSSSGVDEDTVIDQFAITESRGVEYTINIYDSGANMRVMRLQAGWTSDGSDYADDGGIGTTIIGDTSPVTMSVVVTGSIVQLFAAVTSGEWTIEGTRKYVPNNGSGIVNPTSLADGRIWIGNASNTPTPVTVTGDVTFTNAGVSSITSGVIVNADISASAAVALTKLATLTASRAVVSDSSGYLTTSATTAAQIGFLSTVTSDVQVQLDGKLSAATGAISTVVSVDLTASRAVISNPLGKIAVSSVTTTELGYLSGVTSAIQTQLNNKVSGTDDTITIPIGDWNMDSSLSVTINLPTGVTRTNFRNAIVSIRTDGPTDYLVYPLSINAGLLGGYYETSNIVTPADTITLYRTIGGFFDNSNFDSTGYNRGWITITYDA
jgi:hypothetical protein